MKYSLAVHDPHFYWQTYNGLTIPKASLSLEIGGDTYLVLAATVYEEMDRREARCEEDKGYSFTACARVRGGQLQPLLTVCHICVDRAQQDHWMSDSLGYLVRHLHTSLYKCQPVTGP